MAEEHAPAGRHSRHEVRAAGTPASGLGTLAVGVIVIAALYFGREVFVPLTLAILLSFALGPVVLLLRRWHFGRVPSIIVTVGLAFFLIFCVGTLLGSQIAELARDLPQYESNIALKIDTLRGSAAENGVLSRAAKVLTDLRSDITKTSEPPALATRTPAATAGGQKAPLVVEIHQPDPAGLEIVESVIGPLLEPLTTVGIVVVFVIFLLLQREDLRDRFIRLAGSHDLRRTTEAIDDAARRLSRYLLTQTAINAIFGLLIGIGLWLIGVPNPVLLGVIAMMLRFVPYIGVVIAAGLSAAIATAVDPGWSILLWTIGLFFVSEPITSQIVEPHLYARSTGLSAIAVMVAAGFWTWLWGPVGLLLSTPLTMCLVVLGRHVDRLEFLDVILGNQPALAPEESFYQRILAGNPDEAASQAEEFLRDKPLSAYYDDVAIKGLALAQADVNRGALDHLRRVRIKDAVDDVIDNLSDHDDKITGDRVPGHGAKTEPPSPPPEPDPVWKEKAVLCIAGRGSLDESAAAMLAQLLEKHGIGARVVTTAEVAASALSNLDTTGVRLACLSYLEPGGLTNARYLVRRLRRKLPRARIMVGFWTLTGDEVEEREAQKATSADGVITSLREAVDQIVALAHDAPAEKHAGLHQQSGHQQSGVPAL